MKTGDCFALLAMTFETCDLLSLIVLYIAEKQQ